MLGTDFIDKVTVYGRTYVLTSEYDAELDVNSDNAVKNKTVTGKINELASDKADKTDLANAENQISDLSAQISNIIPITDTEIQNLFTDQTDSEPDQDQEIDDDSNVEEGN